MLGSIETDETIEIRLDDKKDTGRLLSLTEGKSFLIALPPLKTVFCADEEGARLIFDEFRKKFSGENLARIERVLAMHTDIYDEITLSDIKDRMAEAEIETDGRITVEITDRILAVKGPEF